ncbi:MAG: ROK family protein, partial [Phototrophicaceae bacterium]
HRFILYDAKPCSCGNFGCLETLVAEPYLVAQARIHRDVSSFSDITTLAAQGDDAMFQILEQSARYLGIAVANLINTFSPELILLGGVYTNHSNLLLPIIKEEVQNGVFANILDDVQITVASPNAALIGAATFALDQYFYHPTEAIGEL